MGEVLMLRKRETKRWEFPGGKQEGYETTRGCAARELLEETGIELGDSSLHLLGTWENEFRRSPRRLPPYICQFYLTRVRDGQEAIVGEPDKFDGAEWVRPELIVTSTLQGPALAALEMLEQKHPYMF